MQPIRKASVSLPYGTYSQAGECLLVSPVIFMILLQSVHAFAIYLFIFRIFYYVYCTYECSTLRYLDVGIVFIGLSVFA